MQAFRKSARVLGITFVIGLLSFVAMQGGSGPSTQRVAPLENRKPLRPIAFYPLPLTSVKPEGWLRRQLEIQAAGLSGHLDEVWRDVGPNSGWLGGTGESWERGPYFVDGLVPLAYLLDDPELIAKAEKWVNWTLTHQRPDGGIGPPKNTDWWPNIVMLKALTQYQEATGDPRVIPLMERYFHYQAAHLATRPLQVWAKFRWADEVVSILWLYNRTGDEILLGLADVLDQQGYNWKADFANFPFTSKTTASEFGLKPGGADSQLSLSAHGVNNAMALKTLGVWWEVSGDDSDQQATFRQLEELYEYHGLPNGMFSCDEHLAGRSPTEGTELCSVVEAQFSLEQLVGIFGTPSLADLLEKISYNALPGTFSPDIWAHQYVQQPNQVMCNLEKRDWNTDGPESNIYGLEPEFGCCTANMHQGWPKFVASLWMATPDQGLAAIAYGPNVVKTVAGKGIPVEIKEETDYPFRGTVRLTVDPSGPTAFPLRLRIPSWAEGATIAVNGEAVDGVRPDTFYTLDHLWKKGDLVLVEFPLRVRVSKGYNSSVVVSRGSLVFSLKIGEKWEKIATGMSHPAKSPAADWEVLPSTPWNYGLMIDRANPGRSVEVIEKRVGANPFSPEGTPVELRVKGRQIAMWTLVDGSAGPLPDSPTTSDQTVEILTLIPYGAAKLRITDFPQIAP
jgi:DUF1680 family protein